jgi:hypothetical protein
VGAIYNGDIVLSEICDSDLLSKNAGYPIEIGGQLFTLQAQAMLMA